MTRLPPRPREDLGDLEPHFRALESRMSFLPTSMLVMAHKPELVAALGGLARVVYDPDAKVDLQLRNMVGHVASKAAGCMYCTAHTTNNAVRSGVDADKIAALWHFESSPLFDDRERAALRLAVAAAVVPNAVTDELMSEVLEHFDPEEVVELMAVIAWFGFLNRWNDSLATELEDLPTDTAQRVVGHAGWSPGKHAPRGSE